MKILVCLRMMITVLFCLCNVLQLYYICLSLLKKKPESRTAPFRNRYAILICARNEERVIADLLESIAGQTYPQELLDTYVMADNCSDRTASIARRHGAIVYERFHETLIGKGYALEELLRQIGEDHAGEYAGYFVFDADNILKEDFIEKMNDSYHEGHEIITSYRNSKNPSGNWISAGYTLNFIKDCRFLNYPRDLSYSSCKITGTGFFFSERIRRQMEDWPYHLLTEDLQFTIDQTCQGEKIAYCQDAVIYDEQPEDFKQSWQQRKRWVKGYLQVFRRYGSRLVRGMLRGSFACFDLCCHTIFAYGLSIASVIVSFLMILLSLSDELLLEMMLYRMLLSIVNAYVAIFMTGLLTTICEWKKIRAVAWRKILHLFSYPIFIFTYVPISIAAVFSKVTWKPIQHCYKMDIRSNC